MLDNKNLLSNDKIRCNNHRCPKRNRCNLYLQVQIDIEDFKKQELSKSVTITRYEHQNCARFIEFDDNN